MGDPENFDGFASNGPAVGYSVCANCFDDEIAAPLDCVVGFVLVAVTREYERAVEALGWDGAEGGYLGMHWDSYELIDEIGLSLPEDDGRLLKILVKCFGDQEWCERDPYAQRRDARLVSSWERFCRFIKHKRRHFFLQQKEEEPLAPGEYLTPSELLKFIGQTVDSLGLVKTLPADFLIYRARQVKTGQVLQSSYDFAPPPIERAVRSNRMSPAGVVMFYGSDDPKTAAAEIDDDPKLGVAVGTFRPVRQARVLDLTDLPRPFGFFEQESETSEIDRYAVAFLHNFVKSLAAKVEPGDREHVDYVTTQVVTEWFRTVFQKDESPLDGIAYPSTQNQGGCSLVLFANRYDVTLTGSEIKEASSAEKAGEWIIRSRHEKAWLKLVRRKLLRAPC